jgi:hypothetical protein
MSKRIMKNAMKRKVKRYFDLAAAELLAAGEQPIGDANGFIAKLKAKVTQLITKGCGE